MCVRTRSTNSHVNKVLFSSIKCDGKLWGTINAEWRKQVGDAFEDDCSGQLIGRKDLWVGGHVG